MKGILIILILISGLLKAQGGESNKIRLFTSTIIEGTFNGNFEFGIGIGVNYNNKLSVSYQYLYSYL